MNPLDLRGPEFLGFYIAWGVGVLVLGMLAREVLRRWIYPGEAATQWLPGRYPKEGDAYGIALLRSGHQDVVRTILARLSAADLIAVEGHELRRVESDAVAGRLPDIERRAWEKASGDTEECFLEIEDATAPAMEELGAKLRNDHLLRTPAETAPLWALFGVMLLAGPGMGVAKILVAIGRGRANIGFLILLSVIFVVLTWLLFRPTRQTRAGRDYLDWLKESHRGLLQLVLSGRRASAGEIGLVTAIFGLGAVAGLDRMAALRMALRPKSSSGDAASSTSSCGSGCGGGSCGGGGCGGCGGD